MKRIDVVELYVKKRIEKLEQNNGKFELHSKEIAELKDVLDVINQTNAPKKTQSANKAQDANKADAFIYSLSKINEHLLNAKED